MAKLTINLSKRSNCKVQKAMVTILVFETGCYCGLLFVCEIGCFYPIVGFALELTAPTIIYC